MVLSFPISVRAAAPTTCERFLMRGPESSTANASIAMKCGPARYPNARKSRRPQYGHGSWIAGPRPSLAIRVSR